MALIRPRKITSPPIKPEADTIPKILWQRVNEWGERIAMRKKYFGLWKNIVWREYGQKVKYIALALQEMGLQKGDRVSILSEDNPEWLYTDFGTQSAGCISVGIYPTDSFYQVEYVVKHSQSKFCICEDEEQLDKILQVRHNLPDLKKIIVIDMEGLHRFTDPMAISFEEALKMGRKVDESDPELFYKLLLMAKPNDTAFLVYTSGTTGQPKGAMITHNNALCAFEAFRYGFPGFMDDELLTFLPLCHIAERELTALGMIINGWVCSFAEGPDTVPQDIREVSPTIFFGVPRIWEKFYSTLILSLKDATLIENLAYKAAMAIGVRCSDYRINGMNPPLHLRALFWLAELLVLRNFKRLIGLERVRMCLSGAAPISPDLLKFYFSLGFDMRQAYGQTEATGTATMNYPGETNFNTVGKPLPGIEVKISEDGEIIVRGQEVFQGYFRDPEKTSDTIRDGWLHTGDVGMFNEDCQLVIKDRIKDIIITSGGKNITPSEIENQLKFSPYINDAVVIGDGRKYLTALIMIDDENVMKYAQDKRIPFTTYASLTKQPEIIKLIGQEVEKVNKKFARVETIKKFSLIDIQLTADDDEITPTGKLKRKLVSEKFKEVIEAMY